MPPRSSPLERPASGRTHPPYQPISPEPGARLPDDFPGCRSRTRTSARDGCHSWLVHPGLVLAYASACDSLVVARQQDRSGRTAWRFRSRQGALWSRRRTRSSVSGRPTFRRLVDSSKTRRWHQRRIIGRRWARRICALRRSPSEIRSLSPIPLDVSAGALERRSRNSRPITHQIERRAFCARKTSQSRMRCLNAESSTRTHARASILRMVEAIRTRCRKDVSRCSIRRW